jgi:putative serine protease PepD
MTIHSRPRHAGLRVGLSTSSVAALALVAVLVGACGAATSPGSSPSSAASTPSLPTTDGAALALQRDFIDVVRTVGPSVVVIETAKGLGSGIIYDTSGNIVTNAHVTDGSKVFTVTLADGRRFEGRLVGSFAGDDLAVVHIDATNLTPAKFADSSKLVVGDIVLAVGNPLGLQSSVSEGIVSAVGRTVAESGNVTLPNVIQTSAAINPGNSGGALVDLSAQVVGIPTLAAEDPQMGGAAVGIGFAIPSNVVTDIAGQLIKNGRVLNSHRAYLGVNVADVMGGTGVLVHSLQAGGPAAKAGIAAGDLITSVNGQPTPSSGALSDLLANLTPGQAVRVSLVRPGGTTATLTVTLGELPG